MSTANVLAFGGRLLAGLGAWHRRGPGLSVLMFHRVYEEPDPLFPRELTARRFDSLMAVAARAFNVLSFGDAVRALADGRLPARALAITFDDGYADNHDQALPILRRHGLPATFFIATRFLDGGLMFNDEVIENVRRSTLPRIDLSALGLPELPLGDAAQRRAVINQILPVLKYDSLSGRAGKLALLREACGHPSVPSDLMMTRAQVRALADAGMEIGAHTLNHPILRLLDDREAEAEMLDSRRELEQITGRRVGSFAFPNGKPGHDYDERHVQIARRLGFDAAASTVAGVCRPGADLYQLPRYTPWQTGVIGWLAALSRHHAFA